MTTSRIVRGTKGRVFLYVCAVLFVTGLIACYNNVRVQLDDTRKSFELCRQEQENLSTQLQVLYDYKQRLEKSLKSEKGEHQRLKNEQESKLNEEKLKNDKINEDSKLRFSTLQQHYNLLQTQHDDFKEECSKIQRQQLDEINNLQSKLKEVKEQLKRAENDKENSVQNLKTQNELLKEEKEKLLKKIQNGKTHKEETPRTEISTTTFSKIIADGKSHYVVPDLENSKNVVEEPESPAMQQLARDTQVLPLPGMMNAISVSSSTPNSLASKPDMKLAPPLKSPATPETLRKTTSKESKVKDTLQIPHPAKRIPEGVVKPVENQVDNVQMNQFNEDANSYINKRYMGNIVHAEKVKVNPDENVANEEYDALGDDNKMGHLNGPKDYQHDDIEDDDGEGNGLMDPAIRN